MKKFARRINKIAYNQYSDELACKGVTKMQGKNKKRKKRMLRGFKKSKRQELKHQLKNVLGE